MNAKHTPGPWGIAKDEKGDRVVVDSNGIVVCRRMPEPDARLIAAAPLLLQALQDHHAHLKTSPTHNEMECRYCQIIAKAEGRP